MSSATSISYAGKDLEAMAFAPNYHRWILEIFAPYMGSRLVEVGAGTGTFSGLILERRPESLTLVEPSREMFSILDGKVRGWHTSTRVAARNDIFTGVADEIRLGQKPDSIIYVNVLEHIEDDEGELRAVNRTLERGGRLFIFVPAMRWLYGSFDRKVDHFRRYMRPELEGKCRGAGFKVLKSIYFDFAGIAPWWVKYCLFKSDAMESGLVRVYDRFVVPVVKSVETVVAPPVGKNILLVAEKESE
jgi:SAM-dependent methyltransferase